MKLMYSYLHQQYFSASLIQKVALPGYEANCYPCHWQTYLRLEASESRLGTEMVWSTHVGSNLQNTSVTGRVYLPLIFYLCRECEKARPRIHSRYL